MSHKTFPQIGLILLTAILSAQALEAQDAPGPFVVQDGAFKLPPEPGEDAAGYVVFPDGTTNRMGLDGTLTEVDAATAQRLREQAARMHETLNEVRAGDPTRQQIKVTRTIEPLKTALGCSDEEWALLNPKIRIVQILRAAVVMGSVGGGGPESLSPIVLEVRAKQQDLQKAMADKAPAAVIGQTLASFREVRSKAREELAKASRELAALLTVSQEAILVQRNILD